MSKQDQVKVFTGHETNVDLRRLKEEFAKKKKIVKDYEKQILIALSHYPELKDVAIEFVFTHSGHPMSARPKPATLFRKAKHRTYCISISSKISSMKEPLLLRNLPYALQVLQFGHELGHVLDYITKSSVQLLAEGILYEVPSIKRKLEQTADREAIKHGFGKQVLEFSKYIYELQEKYPKEKTYFEYHKYYMTPGEASAEMRRLSMYKEI